MKWLTKILPAFVEESNRIEGLAGPTYIEPSRTFLELYRPSVDGLCRFVRMTTGDEIRTAKGANVRVGDHKPPPGGPEIAIELDKLIQQVIHKDATPFEVHCRYETLHPFMDGNGRSGRILWAWQMIHHSIAPGLSLGFLHAFYYQALAAHEGDTKCLTP